MLKMRVKAKRPVLSDESGVVTIVIAILIIMLVSLISIAYIGIANREQRQALDRQLNTQALYAAEAGINDAVNAINGGFTGQKTDCGTDATFPDNKVGSDSTVQYTCLLINQSPKDVKFDDLTIERAQIFPISTDTDVKKITIAWQPSGVPASPAATYYNGCNSFGVGALPKVDEWNLNCKGGMLRVDLVPLSGTISHTALAAATKTIFLRPTEDVSGQEPSEIYLMNFTAAPEQGRDIKVRCQTTTTPRHCVVNLDVTSITGREYFMRVGAIYNKANVIVTPYDGTASTANPIPVKGTQIEVDSTGKAGDVYRRVQARVPIKNQYDWPDYTIRSMENLCKQFSVAPGFVRDDGACGLN